jgi:hypothetical protein
MMRAMSAFLPQYFLLGRASRRCVSPMKDAIGKAATSKAQPHEITQPASRNSEKLLRLPCKATISRGGSEILG